ncbi:hypothetical protein D6827_00985 [Candidatus Parcubacteria bacterium]|nr:MAG: hypothetical protein D6827_00985 [Candidatus Parcubacteria bacterium]
MGLVWGTTDFETSFGFKIKKNGVKINQIRMNHTMINIPGLVGVKLVDSQPTTRTISITGYIIAVSNSDLMTKINSMSDELGAGWTPNNPVAGGTTSVVTKDLSIPGLTYKFECAFNGIFNVEFIGPSTLTDTAQIQIEFIQVTPTAK